jgi:hypothetical protein
MQRRQAQQQQPRCAEGQQPGTDIACQGAHQIIRILFDNDFADRYKSQ